MSGMDELVAWLRVQLDDDERVAREVSPGPWRAEPFVYGPPDEFGEPSWWEVHSADRRSVVSHYPYEGGGTDRVNAEHIVRWDPARVLAEVETKRRILDAYLEADADDLDAQFHAVQVGALRPVLRLLALVYADRPGYRDEWRPAA